jgi:hypothetical protein
MGRSSMFREMVWCPGQLLVGIGRGVVSLADGRSMPLEPGRGQPLAMAIPFQAYGDDGVGGVTFATSVLRAVVRF